MFAQISTNAALLLVGLACTAAAQEVTPTGLCDADWQVRNTTAAKLAADASRHVRELIELTVNEDHERAQPGSSEMPPGSANWTSDYTPNDPVVSRLWELLPGSAQFVTNPRVANDSRLCNSPELDRQLIVPWSTRMLSAWLLGHVKGDERSAAVEALREVLRTDIDSDLRFQCLASLGRLGEPGHAAIAGFLHRSHVRFAAGYALSRAGEAGQRVLYAQLTGDSPRKQRVALSVLKEEFVRRQPGHLKLLLDLYLHGDDKTFSYAGGWLRDLCKPEIEALLRALSHKSASVRHRAAVFLAAGQLPLEDDAFAKLLDRVAVESDEPTMYWCLTAVQGERRGDAIRGRQAALLEKLLADSKDEPELRAVVVRSMGALGSAVSPRILESLCRAVNKDPERAIRYRAALSLQELGELRRLSIEDLEAGLSGKPDVLHDVFLRAVCAHGDSGLPLLRATAERYRYDQKRLAEILRASATLDREVGGVLDLWLGRDSVMLQKVATAGLLGAAKSTARFPKLRQWLIGKKATAVALRDLVIGRYRKDGVFAREVREMAERGHLPAVRALGTDGKELIVSLAEKRKASSYELANCLAELDPDPHFIMARILPLLRSDRERVRLFAVEVLERQRELARTATDALLRLVESNVGREVAGDDMLYSVRSAWQAIGEVGEASARTVERIRAIELGRPLYSDGPVTRALVLISSRMKAPAKTGR